MLVAIALQESRAAHRKQIGGPARSYWQFETIGVAGVLEHPSTRFEAELFLGQLDYSPASIAAKVYLAIEHNDVLAAGLARLLLWTLPKPLPERHDAPEGWAQYLAAWRPGKPHPETWGANWAEAWQLVGGSQPAATT